jgi:beta-xylosidase
VSPARRLAWLALALAMAAPVAARMMASSLFDGADPDANALAGGYWVYPTGDGTRLDAWSSPDLRRWTRHDALLRLEDVRWRDDGAADHALWAPDMVKAHGRYFLYYALGPQAATPSRIGVATCAAPAGPCEDSGRPLVTGGGGFEAIDPMVFEDRPRRRWLLYAGGSAGATLRVYQLRPDMVTIDRRIDVDQPPRFAEGVFIHRHRGRYYLSYSSGRWTDASYEVRYAVSSSPTGPWRDGGVILKSDARYKGPGHHSILRDRRGRWWIIYHRWENETGDGPYRGSRRVAIAPLRYGRDGAILPVDMGASASGAALSMRSSTSRISRSIARRAPSASPRSIASLTAP